MVGVRNGGKINSSEKCFYDYTELEIVDVFTYLGFNFKYNGKFDCIQNSIATQAKKWFFLQWKKVKEKSLNVEITLFLFDTFISSVPDYGCETS